MIQGNWSLNLRTTQHSRSRSSRATASRPCLFTPCLVADPSASNTVCPLSSFPSSQRILTSSTVGDWEGWAHFTSRGLSAGTRYFPSSHPLIPLTSTPPPRSASPRQRRATPSQRAQTLHQSSAPATNTSMGEFLLLLARPDRLATSRADRARHFSSPSTESLC